MKPALILAFTLVINYSEPATARSPGLYRVFQFADSVRIPGCTKAVYDSVTGDISRWWDHTFSENPVSLTIDPKPGGAFLEVFNTEGEGVLHAVVTYAERGKGLRFEGPLGLAGKAVHMVTTYRFASVEPDSTCLYVDIHLAGEIDEPLLQIVKRVWHHFLKDRFKPYMEHTL